MQIQKCMYNMSIFIIHLPLVIEVLLSKKWVKYTSRFDFYKSSEKILKNPVFKSTFIFLDVY